MSSDSKTFQDGQRIVTEGEPVSLAYMILSGRARVSLEKNEKSVELAILETGSVFGETALFGGHQYGANVDALGETKLMPISPQIFTEKIDNSDPMLKAMIEMLISRLNHTNKALLESETREFIDIGFI